MRIFISALPLIIAAPFALAGEGEVLEIGKSLSVLRAEVDALSHEVQLARDEAREEQMALARRKAALAGDLEEARLTEAALGRRLRDLQQTAAARATAADHLATPIHDAIERLREDVRRGIPFKVRDRVARLDEVDHVLAVEGPARAAAALWTILDDEIALTRSSQRARQSIELAGKPVLADILRIGMVALFFRTGSGDAGLGQRNPDGSLVWHVLDDSADRARIDALFEALRKETPLQVVLAPLPPTLIPRATASSTKNPLESP